MPEKRKPIYNAYVKLIWGRTILKEVRHMEETQFTKKLKHLKFTVVLGEKNFSMGSTLKSKHALVSF